MHCNSFVLNLTFSPCLFLCFRADWGERSQLGNLGTQVRAVVMVSHSLVPAPNSRQTRTMAKSPHENTKNSPTPALMHSAHSARPARLHIAADLLVVKRRKKNGRKCDTDPLARRLSGDINMFIGGARSEEATGPASSSLCVCLGWLWAEEGGKILDVSTALSGYEENKRNKQKEKKTQEDSQRSFM
jgi:hypothetical protein